MRSVSANTITVKVWVKVVTAPRRKLGRPCPARRRGTQPPGSCRGPASGMASPQEQREQQRYPETQFGIEQPPQVRWQGFFGRCRLGCTLDWLRSGPARFALRRREASPGFSSAAAVPPPTLENAASWGRSGTRAGPDQAATPACRGRGWLLVPAGRSHGPHAAILHLRACSAAGRAISASQGASKVSRASRLSPVRVRAILLKSSCSPVAFAEIEAVRLVRSGVPGRFKAKVAAQMIRRLVLSLGTLQMQSRVIELDKQVIRNDLGKVVADRLRAAPCGCQCERSRNAAGPSGRR